jgi:hypothetical protein
MRSLCDVLLKNEGIDPKIKKNKKNEIVITYRNVKFFVSFGNSGEWHFKFSHHFRVNCAQPPLCMSQFFFLSLRWFYFYVTETLIYIFYLFFSHFLFRMNRKRVDTKLGRFVEIVCGRWITTIHNTDRVCMYQKLSMKSYSVGIIGCMRSRIEKTVLVKSHHRGILNPSIREQIFVIIKKSQDLLLSFSYIAITMYSKSRCLNVLHT